MMKVLQKLKLLGLALTVSFGAWAQEDCKDEINYSVSNFTLKGNDRGYTLTEDVSVHVTVGNVVSGASGGFVQGIAGRGGFWGHYLLEPQAPRTKASEGEYVDRIEVEWEVVDSYRGPVVTGEQTKIYRNGRLLTSVPVAQTSYVDYNVFPGEFYTYEIVTSNSYGDAKPMQAVGFLNPNGRVTGKVESRSGTPVADVKVTLSPNLGRTLDMDGTNDYVYFVDQSYQLSDYYTVEGWFYNLKHNEVQTLFAATDSMTTTPVVKIMLDAEGKLRYYHDGNADGTGVELVSKDGYNLNASTRQWHHFAAVYDTAEIYLYVDGNRVAKAANPSDPVLASVELEFGKGGAKVYGEYFQGYLDEYRVWDIGRTRSAIRKYKDITLTGEEAGLKSYWKFDEQFSNKVFDFADLPVEEREHGFLCDVLRSDFISPAQLGAYTDEAGDYIIKGVYYGNGTTFSAQPSKRTPIGFSLDFDGTDDYISYQLDRMTYHDAFTIEGWFKTPNDGKDMTIFEATNVAADQTLIHLGIQNGGQFVAQTGFSGSLNTITSTASYGDEFWYHYALVHDGSTVKLYIDGQEVGTAAGGVIDSVETRTVIGRSGTLEASAGSNYFEGGLDEIRVWGVARTENQITSTMSQVIETNEQGVVDAEGTKKIMANWKFGEGQGTLISDATPNNHTGNLLNHQEVEVSPGEFIVTNWNGDDIPLNVEFFTHDFDPNSRSVSLDPSNTSVDRVDFTDISQLAVSGFVKFAGVNCFAPSIEMKLNGASLFPPVYTDEDGKFIVELEPGTSSAFLSAEYEGYTMDPGYIELPRMVRPIAGVKFEVTTKRNLKGIVAGGECLYATGAANISIKANDGCYEVIEAIDPATGEFDVSGLPPYVYDVSVIDHNNTLIQSAFDLQGATTVDLRDENDSISFIYTSPTEMWMDFANPEPNDCGIQLNAETATLLNQNSEYDLQIKLYQVYGVDTCYLQSGTAYIDDQISDFSPKDTVSLTDGLATYTLTAGIPNLTTPYDKSISVVGEDDNGDQVSGFTQAIVLGFKTLNNTFETTTPQLPLFILRDPPGDGSFAYLDQNEEICNTMSFQSVNTSTNTSNGAIHMGPDITFSTGFFLSKETVLDVTLDAVFENSGSNTYGTTISSETCLSTSEIFKTSGNELLSDGEGDVFVGGAFNVLVGTNRVIEVDETTCSLNMDDVVMIFPTSFATTYVYTKQFIESNVIPGLQEINDTASVSQWETILAYNETLKSNAVLKENISFSAGIEYEQSVTSSEINSNSMLLSESFTSEVGLNTGVTLDGIGFSLGISSTFEGETGYERTSQKSTSKTVGYSLSDDDVNDSFTVDVKTDAQGMPVFDLVAGESMCPWEPGTRTRIAVDLSPLSATSLVEIPEDEPAVFRFAVGNIAESAEDQFYNLRVLQESNPDGATILLNGEESELDLFVRAGETEIVTVTVEKGPDAYVFNDLQIEANVECELDKAIGLGQDIESIIANNDTRSTFFARQSFSVEFVKTCQEATIFSPGENWLINNQSDNRLPITISSIDLSQAEFERFLFQYRRKVEGEPFVNGKIINRDSIAGDSYSFDWDVTDVVDGAYELRVVSECNSGFLPGASAIVNGRIDRQAPTALGSPSPIDAVLGLDDEIKITFNEDINCDEIISLGVPVSMEVGNVNNINLSNTETGLAIEKEVTCVGNTLVITPNVQNKFIEGQVLRVDILGLKDQYGNVQTEQITWEFTVTRNPLQWQGGDIQSVAYEGESRQFVRSVKNNGAFAVNVNLSGALDVQTLDETNLPAWISASPRSFTVPAGGTQDVTFTISDQLSGGAYQDVVTAATSFGAPRMRFDVRVLCPEPDWEVDASRFENSLTLTGLLKVRNDLSLDEYDIVAAFVGDELRGVGHVQYVEGLDQGVDIADYNTESDHPYRVFMTLYTNSVASEKIDFQVWDASRCELYGQIAESYNISLSTPALGSPTNPVAITVTNDRIQNVPLNRGWNWISFNLAGQSSETDEILKSLNGASRGDIIKSQNQYAQYVPNLGWVGPLDKLDSTKAFRIKLSQKDTLQIVGTPVDFATTTVELDSGWNWVSFLPPVGMEINEAFASFSAQTTADFVIKSQTSFAQFVENGVGWIGSLVFLQPNKGYQIYSTKKISFEYPLTNQNARTSKDEHIELPENWTLTVGDYETNVSIIARVQGVEAQEGDLIGFFKGDDFVGYGRAVYIHSLGQYYFFITVYGDDLTDLDVEYVQSGVVAASVYESLSIPNKEVIGSIDNPLVIDIEPIVSGVNDPLTEVSLYPNPASGDVVLNFTLDRSQEVEVVIKDLSGRVLNSLGRQFYRSGANSINLARESGDRMFESGLYLVQLNSADGKTVTRKLIWR